MTGVLTVLVLIIAGVQVWPDGSSYEGVFSGDLRHGQGTQSWQDGSVCSVT